MMWPAPRASNQDQDCEGKDFWQILQCSEGDAEQSYEESSDSCLDVVGSNFGADSSQPDESEVDSDLSRAGTSTWAPSRMGPLKL